MPDGLLLGIDSGLSVTKAVVFSTQGKVVSLAARRVEHLTPAPRCVERDMRAHWLATCEAIREAISIEAVRRQGITAMAVTGHGDGIYLLDETQTPLGNAIISLDSRAAAIVDAWRRSGVAEQSLALTGQYPFDAAASALLACIKVYVGESYRRIGWVL